MIMIKRVFSVILTMSVVFGLVIPLAIHFFATGIGTLTGETSRAAEEIKLPNGASTGVSFTQINLSGYYGSGKVVSIAECDLSNTRLSIEAINCGTSTVKRQLVTAAAKNFSTNGKTVLAAINGDLWMTAVNSNSNVTKNTLCTTRGVMIIDREIWATQEFGMENYVATSNPGTTASLKSALGMTSENQPLVGAPVFTVKVTNETKGKTVKADGLNRLPAWDSLVVYNHRLNNANYALNDSYEIEIEAASTAFTVDNTVRGTVKAIYPSGSSSRPAIGANSIILTARGSRMAELSSCYTVGDVVSFDFSLVDEYGRTEMWQDVVDAIGGHMPVLQDGKECFVNTSTSEYPTSLIGINDEGKVIMCNVASSSNGVYIGLKFNHAVKFCKEIGYNSVFYLDGGGSATMVTLKEGTYTVRNCTSDGSPRSVINAVGIVWNSTPVCEKQGTLSYIDSPEDLKGFAPTYIDGALMNRIAYFSNAVSYGYNSEEKAFRITTAETTNDPFVVLDFTGFEEINAEDCPYILIRYKTSNPSATGFSIYYGVGNSEISAESMKNISIPASDTWRIASVPMASAPGWEGRINTIRLDIFDNTITQGGVTLDIEFMALCKSTEEVRTVRNGGTPLGSIRDFLAYKDCDVSHTFNTGVKVDDATHIVYCGSCGLSVVQPHSFSEEYTVDVKPTYTTTGLKSRHCKYCDAVTDLTEMPILVSPGDVNGDGRHSSFDILFLKRYIAGVLDDSDIVFENADVNGDGRIRSTDLRMLKMIISG